MNSSHHELRITNYESRITNHELRITNHELEVNRIPRIVMFAGIIVTGIGLIYGVVRNDERQEFMYLASGIVIFIAGYFFDRKR